MLRNLICGALSDTVSLLQWVVEFLTPDDPTPLGVIEPAWQRVDNPWGGGMGRDADGRRGSVHLRGL